MKRITTERGCLFALLACLLTAGLPAGAETPLCAAKLGLMAELSGPFAGNGEDCRRGYETARSGFAPGDLVGGRAVQFIYGDSRGDPKSGVAEFSRLVEAEQVLAVVTNRSQIAMALAPLSGRRGVPLLATAGAEGFTEANKYAFRFWPTAEHESRALAKKVIELGYKETALLTSNDEYNLSLTKYFRVNYGALGGAP
jgi:branched-chain amino acid transport system substrate-binding protein